MGEIGALVPRRHLRSSECAQENLRRQMVTTLPEGGSFPGALTSSPGDAESDARGLARGGP
jgi:hypothetical protein